MSGLIDESSLYVASVSVYTTSMKYYAVFDSMKTADPTFAMLQTILCLVGLAVLLALTAYWIYLIRLRKHKKAVIISRILLVYAVVLIIFNLIFSLN